MMGKKEMMTMSLIGNILWFFVGGFLPALLWFFFGLLWCLTIVGIPIGVQCFKMADLQLLPFGRDVYYDGAGLGSFVLNVLWIIFGGIELAVANATIGVVLCLTIVGIPFGMQSFKMAKLSLMPFGAKIRRIG